MRYGVQLSAGTAIISLMVTVAPAATYYVGTEGRDANPGTESRAFRTIQKAAETAVPRDTVVVKAGVYYEEVALRGSGIAFRAFDANRPVIDGGKERQHGFSAAEGYRVEDIVIDGFEIRNVTLAGIILSGSSQNRWVVRNCEVHHVPLRGLEMRGTGHLIQDNVIWMIGNLQEAMGILLKYCRKTTVHGNQIFFCHKEGIRDIFGIENLIEGNIIYMCWTGIAYNYETTGTMACNNFVYSVVNGFYPKQVRGSNGWNRFWHNTVHNAASRSVRIGGETTPMDYLDVRNNIFSKAGDQYVYESTSATGPHIIIDGNCYHPGSGRPPSYYSPAGDPETLAELRAATVYEDHGLEFNPELADPDSGELDYASASPAAAGSIMLASPYGNQLGARGIVQTAPSFFALPMTAIDASTNKAMMSCTTDGKAHTTWDSGSANSNQWIVYDLGSRTSFRYIVLYPWMHHVESNVRRYVFEVSDDNRIFNVIKSGANIDSGSIFIYELSPPAAGRYFRFSMVDNFPDDGLRWTSDQFKFSDITVGNLEERDGGPQPMLTFVANPDTIESGATSVLAWSCADATDCIASGGWTGTKSLSGIQRVTPARTTTYILTCAGNGGMVRRSVTVTVVAPPAEAPYGSKTIDGDSSDWTGVRRNAIAEVSPGTATPIAADMTGRFAVAWDEQYLYVLAEIGDDEYDPFGDVSIFCNDGIEIMLDGLRDRSTSFGSDDHQIFLRADGVVSAADLDAAPDAVVAAARRTASGYLLEAAVRWSYIGGNAPRVDGVYGFDIAVNDRDHGVREHQAFWAYAPSHWNDTSAFGYVVLRGVDRWSTSSSRIEVPFASKEVDGLAADWTLIPQNAMSDPAPALPIPSPAPADLTANFRLSWDRTYLYILAEVSDDEYDVTGSSRIFGHDGIEIMIDGLADHATAFGVDDHQFFVRGDGAAAVGGGALPGEGDVLAASGRTESGYCIEVGIRWTYLAGNVPQDGTVYGFNIAVNDRDGEVRESQVFWKFVANHWRDTSSYGDIILVVSRGVMPARPKVKLGF